MKTRTVYDILDDVMKDYEYTLKKEGNKIEVTGKVVIKKLGKVVDYSKEFYVQDNEPNGAMEKRICGFKDEFRKKIVDEIKLHKELLEDDDMLIDHLLDEIYCQKRENEQLKKRIEQLENDLIVDIQIPTQTPAFPGPEQPWDIGKVWCSSSTNFGESVKRKTGDSIRNTTLNNE